ncbi:DUF6879 family protein [Streptomyces triticirhizae]|uniref:DUF6879 domain-containing protein n=1 Tax=Streptomyces triticirhizae TaxID=2483353 RepID=A0A3M2LNV6_9ACTN|nr:DUF6879 family protein [Streptomyces triticirhizae]RMI38796.1 hypothetical protein EBN88_16110 [Streptomyces triticirhizae]
MTTSSKTLGEWFDNFEREAFRLETLDDYGKSGDSVAYQAFLAGKPQPESFQDAGWTRTIRDAVQAGKRMYRVHILSRPLTDYLRFELGWGYLRNMRAGEEFFILDTTDQENPIPDAPDFWLFDERVVGAMRYDGGGAFLGAEFPAEDQLPRFLTYRDEALAQAAPFAEWWAQYGA